MTRPIITRHLAICLLAVVALAAPSLAHAGGNPGEAGPYTPAPQSDFLLPLPTEPFCPNIPADWRDAQEIEGVEVRASRQCVPDDPRWIAIFTRGANNVHPDLLAETGIHPDAVRKSEDRDGDGDLDLIEITLEVMELNGWTLPDDTVQGAGFGIAPGVQTGFWVFAPKTTRFHGGPVDGLWRMPSPTIRVEQGDEVRVRLENTHYIPHTIHFHGVDHPFAVNGSGNDGVPHLSEDPTKPAEAREYTFIPRHPGTMWYHCHVHPHVHVLMGLSGLLVVEPAGAANEVQTLNIGAGEVRHPSVSSRERYDGEFDLHYQDVDKELHDRIRLINDPRLTEWALHRDYDTTDRTADYFLLNGRSFPYTMRESLVTVREGDEALLRVLNAGAGSVSLHVHGHKPTAVAADGVPLAVPEQRDVHLVAAAQRLDLVLNATPNGLDAFSPGAWFFHDHQEQAVTTDGIGPGGDISVVVYEGHQDNRSLLPRTLGMGWGMFFNDAYYRGDVPVWAGIGIPGFIEPPADYVPPGIRPETTQSPDGSDGNGAPSSPAFAAALLLAALAFLSRRRQSR